MATLGAQAQTDITLDDEAMYFDIDDLPNGVKWLPAPPEPNSTQFAYDLGGKQVNEECTSRAGRNTSGRRVRISNTLSKYSP